ncbi:hypothetical protein WJX75_008900 [Coccomyxa subellipsoidea]|uniref:Uncharacterized protein n=1 Tax=Coccomyxa subellipsoidea TaxID=248742 RepID=A0ABR2YB60_9CHLO
MPSSSSTVELPRRITRKQKRLADKSLECLEADTRSTAHEEGSKRRKRERPLQLSLYVRWYSPSGKTKVNRLLLRPVTGVEALEGISKNLVSRAFPESDRPDYLTSEEFLKFTPTDDFMSLPGEIERTEFRLVVTHKAWEYTVLERELGAHRDPLRKMLVTVIEFESNAMMVGHLGLRVSLIAYPVVSVKKSFLEGIEKELRTNPDFKGKL